MNRHFRWLAPTLILFVPTLSFAQDPLQPLLRRLESKKPETRFNALMGIARLGPKAAPATDRLALFLTRFDEDERIPAVMALGKIGKPAVPAAAKLLDHEDETIRHAAVWTLGLIGVDAKAWTPRLLKLVQADPDTDVRSKAVFALTRIAPGDPATLKTLVRILNDDKAPLSVRLAIVEDLHYCGEAAIAPAGEALKNDATYDLAQQSLRELLAKHPTTSAAEAMRPFVETAFAQAKKHQLAEAWRRNGMEFVRWPPKFISDLCDSEGMSSGLAMLGGEFLTPIEKKLHSTNAEEREAACDTLGKIGITLHRHQRAPDMVERIVNSMLPMLQHAEKQTRIAALEAIPKTKAAVEALEALLLDAEVAVSASQAMDPARVGEAIGHVHERFRKAKGEEKARLACAVATLSYDADNLAFFWKHLADPKAPLRHDLACAVGNSHALTMNYKDEVKRLVVPILIESLRSQDQRQRRQAADALFFCHLQVSPDQVPALIAALKDKDANVRWAALRLLGYHDDKRIAAVVQPFLSDPEPEMRVLAASALSRVEAVPELLKAFAAEKDAHVRKKMIDNLAVHDAPAVREALFKLSDREEEWEHALRWLLLRTEGKAFPRIFEILCKQDAVVAKAFRDGPKTPATPDAAATAMASLLKRDNAAENLQGIHVLNKLVPVLYWDVGSWELPVEKAIEERLPKLESALKSKDVNVRREAATVLQRLVPLQWKLQDNFHRGYQPKDPEERRELKRLLDFNQYAIDELLASARHDADLEVRRIARRGMLPPQQPPPWFQP